MRKSFQKKIKSMHALKRMLKNQKGPVVFTNGCFDLLHKGHVHYLEKAKNLGHLLVVALNSDASIRRLKGIARPIHPLADRLEVIAALESVDFVTWFEQETPLELIETLKPHILVKGGDWNPKQIVGAESVLKRGGQVRSLKYIEGHSTTRILAKIHRQTSSD